MARARRDRRQLQKEGGPVLIIEDELTFSQWEAQDGFKGSKVTVTASPALSLFSRDRASCSRCCMRMHARMLDILKRPSQQLVQLAVTTVIEEPARVPNRARGECLVYRLNQDRSRTRLDTPHQRLDLRDGLLDGVEIGGVGRRVQLLRKIILDSGWIGVPNTGRFYGGRWRRGSPAVERVPLLGLEFLFREDAFVP